MMAAMFIGLSFIATNVVGQVAVPLGGWLEEGLVVSLVLVTHLQRFQLTRGFRIMATTSLCEMQRGIVSIKDWETSLLLRKVT